jgi:hypothetical protein
VNNARNFFAGFFEKLSPKQIRDQIDTVLFGPMNVSLPICGATICYHAPHCLQLSFNVRL